MSSSASLRFRIVTNVPNLSPFYLTVEYDTQVCDLRALVAAELAFGEHSTDPSNNQHLHPSLRHDDLSELTSRLKLTLKGSTLSIDEETISQRLGKIYGSSNPHQISPTTSPTSILEEKLFVAVLSPAVVRPTAAAPPVVDEVDKVAKRQQVEQQIRMMEPMIQMMASNPSMLSSMSPELGRLLQEHPEAAREFSNPDTLREMFRAGIDPEARRDMDRSMQSQLSQIQNIPGGMGMLENMMGSVQRDLNQPGPQTAADLTEASEERAMPTPGASSNTRAVPNPWARNTQGRTATNGNINRGGNFMSPFQGGGFGSQQNNGGTMGMFPPQQQQHRFPSLFGQPAMQQHSSTQYQQQQAPTQTSTFVPPSTSTTPSTTTTTPATTTTTTTTPPPSYTAEVAMIVDMGFEGVSEDQIKKLLVTHNGDVDAVVIELASSGPDEE